MEKYKKELKQYITKMQESGYTIDSIKQQLHNHGHTKKIVEETITELKPLHKASKDTEEETPAREEKKKTASPHEPFKKKQLITAKERFFIILYLASTIAFIFWLSYSNDAPLGLVFLCFAPAIAAIVVSILILETSLQQVRPAIWIVPIFAALIFYLISTTGTIFAGVDIANITVANFLISIGFVAIIEFLLSFTTHQKTKTPGKVTTRKTTESKEASQTLTQTVTMNQNRKQLEEYIQSIEDKSKAMNFVVGRVYSNKRGGSPKLRDRIKIDAEWYNEFSKINTENLNENIVVLKKTLWSIYERLLTLDKKENDVFTKTEVDTLTGLSRDKNGEDKIITVLSANDNDPVETYYQSALEFCRKATDELGGIEQK